MTSFAFQPEARQLVGVLGYIPRRLHHPETGSLPVQEATDLFFAPAVRGQQLFPSLKTFAMERLEGPLIDNSGRWG